MSFFSTNSRSPFKKILLITFNEGAENYTDKSEEIISTLSDITAKTPSIIIVATQNSLSGTNRHFQHVLGEEIKKKNYMLFSKVDANTTSILRTLFIRTYNVRTRIYFDPAQVCSTIKNNTLNKSQFKNSRNTNNSNSRNTNTYNSNSSITKKNKYNGRFTECLNKFYITKYLVNRYTPPYSYNPGSGRISIALQFKYPSERQLYTLVVSNYFSYATTTNTTNNKSTILNNP